MYSEHLYRIVREDVEPVLRAMGFGLVELSIGRLKGATRVSIVVYREEGVGVDECAEISRLIFPRLQTMEGLESPSLEVSSPGIERVLKSAEEYAIFRGRGVRILASDHTEWIGGVIERADNGVLALRKNGVVVEYPFSSIRKAKLDYREETPAAARAPLGGRPQPRHGVKDKGESNAV